MPAYHAAHGRCIPFVHAAILTATASAGAFVMGMGAGVWFNSEASFRPNNVASTEMIDRKTPNSELCMANGYSSMVFDQRIFVSFNPCVSSLLRPPCWDHLRRSLDTSGRGKGCAQHSPLPK